MSKCPKCGFMNKDSSTYCTECGSKLRIILINKRKLDLVKNNIRDNVKDITDNMKEKIFISKEITLHFIMAAFLVVYIVISSVLAANSFDGIDGWQLLVRIPLGLLICETLPFISLLISIKNRKQHSHKLAYLEILLYALSILALNLYNHALLDEIKNTDIFLKIYMFIVIIAGTKIVLNINEYTREEKEKEDNKNDM